LVISKYGKQTSVRATKINSARKYVGKTLEEEKNEKRHFMRELL